MLSSTSRKIVLVTKDIHGHRFATLRDSSALSTVLKWTVEFSREKDSLYDDPCYGSSATANTVECMVHVYHMVMDDG